MFVILDVFMIFSVVFFTTVFIRGDCAYVWVFLKNVLVGLSAYVWVFEKFVMLIFSLVCQAIPLMLVILF